METHGTLSDARQAAYDVGQQARQIADKLEISEDEMMERWAAGWFGELPDLGWVMMNHNRSQLCQMGWDGESVEWVTGWRYGNPPECGRSTNHRDNEYEAGVSMMELDSGQRITDWVAEMFWHTEENDWPRVRVRGVLLPQTGGDGEPLLICASIVA